MDRRETAARIRQLRKQRHWNRQQLARQLYMTPSSITRLEQGIRHLLFEEAVRITQIFNISLDELAGLK